MEPLLGELFFVALSWFWAANLQKLVVFYVFQVARATLCGLWAGRPSKTRGFLRFSNRPRDPLRSFGWSALENSWLFAIFKSLARPSAEFRVVESFSLWRGAHFLEAANPKPLPSQWDLLQSVLGASSKSWPSHWNCSALARGSTICNFQEPTRNRRFLIRLSIEKRTFWLICGHPGCCGQNGLWRNALFGRPAVIHLDFCRRVLRFPGADLKSTTSYQTVY